MRQAIVGHLDLMAQHSEQAPEASKHSTAHMPDGENTTGAGRARGPALRPKRMPAPVRAPIPHLPSRTQAVRPTVQGRRGFCSESSSSRSSSSAIAVAHRPEACSHPGTSTACAGSRRLNSIALLPPEPVEE